MDLTKKAGLIEQIADQQQFIQQQLQTIAELPGVGRVRHLGMMIGIPIIETGSSISQGYASSIGLQVCDRARELGLLIRPLGDIVVLMPVLS